MHWVTVRLVCAVGDALGTGGGGPEGGLPLVQRAMVALVPQVVAWVIVLLVMPTGWFVCLSARGVGAGVGRLPVRVAVGAPGAWWAWSGAGVRVGVYVARVAGGLRASGALLPCVWWFVETAQCKYLHVRTHKQTIINITSAQVAGTFNQTENARNGYVNNKQHN